MKSNLLSEHGGWEQREGDDMCKVSDLKQKKRGKKVREAGREGGNIHAEKADPWK